MARRVAPERSGKAWLPLGAMRDRETIDSEIRLAVLDELLDERRRATSGG